MGSWDPPGPGREGLVARSGEGSLGLHFLGPVGLLGLRARTWLCLLSLLVRGHALLQPEHLAHRAGGEGEGRASVGEGRDGQTGHMKGVEEK